MDDALTQFNTQLEAAGFPGWSASDADLFVIFLNTVAEIAAQVATTASTVLPAIFRAFGTQLLNIPYQTGTAATVVSTWTFTSAAPLGGYVVEAGTAVTIDNYVFYLQSEMDVAEGAVTGTGILVASDVGTEYNGLGGVNATYPDVQLTDQIDFVAPAGISIASQASGGVDQEDDDDYQNRLASITPLFAPRPIVEADYAPFVMSDIAANATGVAVGRATAVAGYYPAQRTKANSQSSPSALLSATGNITSGSAAVSVTTPPFYGAIAAVGATIAQLSGSGIPSAATVLASPTPTTTSFDLSANATATASVSFSLTSWTNVTGVTTVYVTDAEGNALTAAEMDALESYLNSLALQNCEVYVQPPAYNTIYVNATVHVLPSYVGNEATVTAAVQSALTSYINPANWGNTGLVAGTGQALNWYNQGQGFNYVRFNSLIGVIENVQGVQYVSSGGLTLGFAASPTGTSDLLLTGVAPLPTSSTTTVTVVADN